MKFVRALLVVILLGVPSIGGAFPLSPRGTDTLFSFEILHMDVVTETGKKVKLNLYPPTVYSGPRAADGEFVDAERVSTKTIPGAQVPAIIPDGHFHRPTFAVYPMAPVAGGGPRDTNPFNSPKYRISYRIGLGKPQPAVIDTEKGYLAVVDITDGAPDSFITWGLEYKAGRVSNDLTPFFFVPFWKVRVNGHDIKSETEVNLPIVSAPWKGRELDPDNYADWVTQTVQYATTHAGQLPPHDPLAGEVANTQDETATATDTEPPARSQEINPNQDSPEGSSPLDPYIERKVDPDHPGQILIYPRTTVGMWVYGTLPHRKQWVILRSGDEPAEVSLASVRKIEVFVPQAGTWQKVGTLPEGGE